MTTKILFFDGVCAMCNGLVIFALKHDKNQAFKFATLQGKTAQQVIPHYSNNLKTVVLKDDSGIHIESAAIIRLLYGFGGLFRLAIILKIIPRPIRDGIYRVVAKHRYRWFGQTENCQLLSPEDRQRILD